MRKKAVVIRKPDRPDSAPHPDTLLRDLKVRDLGALLEAAAKPKSVSTEDLVRKPFFKFEKAEFTKFEASFKSELGPWGEHGVPKGLEPGPDPQPFDRGIRELIGVITKLESTVDQLGRKLGGK